MSFWDLEPDTNSLQNILSNDPTNLKAIIESPDLIQSFRTKDEQLLSVLLNHEAITSLIDIIFDSNEESLSKKAFQLFIAKSSPIIPILANDQPTLEKILTHIKSQDGIKVGYVTRLFTNLFEEEKEKTLNLFNQSSNVLPLLLAYSDHYCVLDLINCYIQNANIENCWFIWSILILIAEKECSECPEIWKKAPYFNFVKFVSQQGSVQNPQKKELINVVMQFIENKNLEKQILDKISAFLPYLMKNSILYENVMKLSLVLPVNNDFIMMCKKLSLSPLPSTSKSVLALKVLTKFVDAK